MLEDLIGDKTRSVGLSAIKRAVGLVTRLLPIPQPTLLVGPGASARLGRTVGAFGHQKLLIVSDETIDRLELMKPLTQALTAGGTRYFSFRGVTQDAPIADVQAGIECFRRQRCDAILAFGGGSVIDAAKAIGLSVANCKEPSELVGYFKGLHGPPALYAVPTTAGTGSEVTVAAVISDPARARKLVIADTRIVPVIAALDPTLMTGLPKRVTAATGIDALTHAVEAYISLWSTEYSDRMALAAVGMIFQNLPVAYNKGRDLAAREAMALAATYAGLAFTRANVGNVHAIAHQLGAKYHTPHGLANAIMLPHVLRFSLPAVAPKLAALAIRAGVATKRQAVARQARLFVDAVVELNHSIGIPGQLQTLQPHDIPELAEAACQEADGNYPVPVRMTREQCAQLLRQVQARNR